jgi:outer membrane lipoprotein-sorting protein
LTQWKTRELALALSLGLPALSGCFVHVRRVPKAEMPKTVLSATPDQLSSLINQRYEKIHSLTAQVTFQVTEGGELKGKEKTITPFSGYIVMQRPGDVRVIGYLPVVHLPAFDMASDGQNFTMLIPPKDRAYTGTNKVTHPSKNPIENMRPAIFFNSLLVQAITPDDLRVLTSETKTIVPAKPKHLLILPLYDLTILRRQSPDSNVLVPSRMIQFDRTTLQPTEEDIYNAQGSIETQAIFGPLVNHDGIQFPSTITIRRPLQEYQILVTFQNIRFNLPLNGQEFHLKVPSGMKVKDLH